MSRSHTKKSGFTLIEILVVIAIMAILSMIIYTSMSGSKTVSRDEQRVSDINSIQLGLELYYNQSSPHSYPQTLSALVPQYINSIPTAPNNGETYGYFPMTSDSGSGICTTYQLWTTFEQSNSNLSSKRGFDSTASPLSNGLFPCGSGGNTVNASTQPLVYDVMPNL